MNDNNPDNNIPKLSVKNDAELSLNNSKTWAEMTSDFSPRYSEEDQVSAVVTNSIIKKKKNGIKKKKSSSNGSKKKESKKYVPKTLTKEEEDRYTTPVLWIKKVYHVPEEDLITSINKAFEEAGRPLVKVVTVFVTHSETRDHAYLLLNSKSGSDLLLDATITVIVKICEEDREGEEVQLAFDIADHLMPREIQDPFILYVWKLPTNMQGSEISKELHSLISKWCPVLDVQVDETQDGCCSGWAKIFFEYEFDTRKCIYMLNYNMMFGTEIRASFCNTDRQPRKAASVRNANPRTQNIVRKTSERNPGPKTEWEIVGREGRRNKRK